MAKQRKYNNGKLIAGDTEQHHLQPTTNKGKEEEGKRERPQRRECFVLYTEKEDLTQQTQWGINKRTSCLHLCRYLKCSVSPFLFLSQQTQWRINMKTLAGCVCKQHYGR